MRSYEATAKTTEEAIALGLQELNASAADVEITVLQEGSKGLFGLFGSRPAKVRLTMKGEEKDPILDAFSVEETLKPAKQPKAEAPKQEKPKAAKKPVEKKAAEKKEKAEDNKPAKKPLPPKAPVQPLEKPVTTPVAAEQLTEETAAGKAFLFLKEMTRLMGVEVEIAVSLDAEGNVFVNMTGDTLGILIGRRGETLDALQYLTSLKVNRGQEGYTRVTLDTENYRAKREDTLIRLANRMANRAVKTGRRVALEPMNPYERRIIHSALQGNELVDTHSEGEEPNRRIVIALRK
ncbi:MAG: RNA-binding cell elongation regulator Jag/EloR [Clostridia bacterium]|nr:RNA-binding cell elongation regulator Jag/EloR [Clostridia bacterium]